MITKWLIERLENLPDDTIVLIEQEDGNWYEAKQIKTRYNDIMERNEVVIRCKKS